MPTPLDNILSSITNFEHKPKIAQAYIEAVDLPGTEAPPWVDGSGSDTTSGAGLAGVSQDSAVAFQYWPETLQDSRSPNWVNKPIPGGSHPIYQWSHGGERNIAFMAVFTTDTEPHDSLVAGDVPYADQQGAITVGRDVDLRSAYSWMRWFTYPGYGGSIDEGYIVNPPAKCRLVLPNSGIGWDGSDYVVAIMTQCDITYQAFFPSGIPRIMEVSLGFAETVQHGGRVQFHDRSAMRRSGKIRSYLPITSGNR